ncbi:MAG: hypothetical protein ACRYFX_12695 [Janthinobacterium lividum]
MSDSYTEAERKAYAAGKAAKSKDGSGKKKKEKKLGPDGLPVKRSGCVLVPDFKYKNGTIGPMLYGWRLSKKFGFVKFNAYLSQDGGRPQSGDHKDECLVFVVNMTVEGLGKLPAQSGVWSLKYKKLSMTDAGLVANPNAKRGGYFGRGGERYKDKVK